MQTHKYTEDVTLTLPDGYDPPEFVVGRIFTDTPELVKFSLIRPVPEPTGLGAVVLANDPWNPIERVKFIRANDGEWLDPDNDGVGWGALTNVEVLHSGYTPTD